VLTVEVSSTTVSLAAHTGHRKGNIMQDVFNSPRESRDWHMVCHMSAPDLSVITTKCSGKIRNLQTYTFGQVVNKRLAKTVICKRIHGGVLL